MTRKNINTTIDEDLYKEIRILALQKGVSANELFKAFPSLKKSKFWGSCLWSKGYYVGTAGAVSSEIIQRYIQNQKLV